MEEQFGAKFMQFTLRLEGCCLIGPQGAQDAQGGRLQGFMEDGHSPQFALQGGGAAPPSVLRASKGGADAALLQGGHQPGPPAKPCGGRD